MPTEAALAWIAKENCGLTGASHYSSMGERGPSQVAAGEAEAMIAGGYMTEDDWSFLGVNESEPGFSLARVARVTAAHFKYIAVTADRNMQRYGLDCERPIDVWSYVKLNHGLPVVAKNGIAAFIAAAGRIPVSFSEFANWVRAGNWTYGTYDIARILTNAEVIGAYAGHGTQSRLLSALFGGVGFVLADAFSRRSG
jgi:hypothetical protein